MLDTLFDRYHIVNASYTSNSQERRYGYEDKEIRYGYRGQQG
jgi:hypothetical protein